MNQLYLEYLRSKDWQRVVEAVLRRDRWRCVSCGFTENLVVHHASYHWIYEELSCPAAFASVITLCHGCHKGEHNLEFGWD